MTIQINPYLETEGNDTLTDLPPLGMDAHAIAEDLKRHFNHTLGRGRYQRAAHYAYESLALTLRDRLVERWNRTRDNCSHTSNKRAYYLSMEFLMGRTLGNAMLNLGVEDEVRQALYNVGLELEELEQSEHDAGLGNGGLGRLAACFMDSCATLQLPVVGYGIRYAYGMFRQDIENGRQVEEPDHWLRNGSPWEIERPEYTQRVKFGGHSEFYTDERGRLRARWVNSHDVLAVPYDLPVPGYHNDTVLTLRLWTAMATDEFDLEEFNAGSYDDAVASKNQAENITMVLYPNDSSENGKELRLRQQYFLASASLQDVLDHWVRKHGERFEYFAAANTFQLNDTHPSCAVPELMRLLMDEHGLDWDEAWEITTTTMAYTNHTLLPEALERWPVRLFGRMMPRLMDIIFEINAHFLEQVAEKWPEDDMLLRRMSLIEEGDEPQVRMAYLAIVGSYSVNGVAELHSELLKKGLFQDFHAMWPERFNNKTNGVTQRRWLAHCNPELSKLITETIGSGWVTDLEQLKKLEQHLDDADFRDRWHRVKQVNKKELADLVKQECGVSFSHSAMFDVQVKRIHEYKRQLLNILHVIHLYNQIKARKVDNWVHRCVLIGGKAAPGYQMAKDIIKLASNVADIVNNAPEVGHLLQVAFFPNYRVTAMEVICPGTDLSEQISTAGKEASGTGNMKFMMNGALTIGTLDGANIEIRDAVGADNFFLFGMTAAEVAQQRSHYDPEAIIQDDPDLLKVMERLDSEYFNPDEPGIFRNIAAAIRSPHDPWMVAADFRAYVNAQTEAARAYRDQEHWTRMSIINTANSGRFSTDRTMQQYNDEIWKLERGI